MSAMNVLLDTCALLALSEGNLPADATSALLAAPEAIVSPIVPWELAIKVKSGKLALPKPPLEWVMLLARRHSLTLLDGISPRLLCAAADLLLIHRDPFDRVLVATAREESLTILTSDRIIPDYPGVITRW